jgi:hypothetical protein
MEPLSNVSQSVTATKPIVVPLAAGTVPGARVPETDVAPATLPAAVALPPRSVPPGFHDEAGVRRECLRPEIKGPEILHRRGSRSSEAANYSRASGRESR